MRSVPRLVIEGNVMVNTNESWSRACIGALVDQHLAQAAPAAAPVAPAPSDS